MDFKPFAQAVHNQVNRMLTLGTTLVVVEVNPDALYDLYLQSFPLGTNPIFREKTEHDCNCCKSFIRKLGGAVSVIDGKVETIWDIDTTGVAEPYSVVAKRLATAIRVAVPKNVLHLDLPHIGMQHNFDPLTTQKYNHFHAVVPDMYCQPSMHLVQNHRTALENSLRIPDAAIETVIELVNSNSLYRGNEKLTMLERWLKLIQKYSEMPSRIAEVALWHEARVLGEYANFRGSSIGALVQAIADGEDLTVAVTKYEKMVAPENYKRTTAVVTQKMVQNAMAKVDELGIQAALTRRFANIADITINNVLFADNSAKKDMGVFTGIANAPVTVPVLDKVEEVSAEHFLTHILPTATSIELMLAAQHENNFVSLVAPVDTTAPNIMAWGNNFSWSYKGEVTDSLLRQRVKSFGGDVDGELRFSIQWNESGNDGSVDLDAHAARANASMYDSGHIYFAAKKDGYGGKLDVDIRRPSMETTDGIAIENISWPTLARLPNNIYNFNVHAYSGTAREGFRAEVAIQGETYSYDFNQAVRDNNRVSVASVVVEDGVATIQHHLPTTVRNATVWGINTGEFVKVRTVMFSPNHWDGEHTGHKHVFFMLDGCVNPDSVRGLYNEHLTDALHPHRKVFEVLGNKLRAPYSENQLSGVGFSMERRTEVLCRVTGKYNRIVKITF